MPAVARVHRFHAVVIAETGSWANTERLAVIIKHRASNRRALLRRVRRSTAAVVRHVLQPERKRHPPHRKIVK